MLRDPNPEVFVELKVGAATLLVVLVVVPNVAGAVVAWDPNNGVTLPPNPVVPVLNVRGFDWPKILPFDLKTPVEVVALVVPFTLENRLRLELVIAAVVIFPPALKIGVDVVVVVEDDAVAEPKMGVVIVLLVEEAIVLPMLEPNKGAAVVFGMLKALGVPVVKELPNNG